MFVCPLQILIISLKNLAHDLNGRIGMRVIPSNVESAYLHGE
jgi:hypothetical protein